MVERGESMSKCLDYENCCVRDESLCACCSRNYEDYFYPRKLKLEECFCVSCKRIISDGHIFRSVRNESIGLCFDCY